MEKIRQGSVAIRRSKVARVVDKLAVESEPGLTNTQLMLTNHDLKPGMTLNISSSSANSPNGTHSYLPFTRKEPRLMRCE